MEELELNLIFEEIRVRGSEHIHHVLRAVEEGRDGIIVQDEILCRNWEKLKENYPTLSDILIHFFQTDYWRPDWREYPKRAISIASISGHEGLYEHDPENPIRIEWDDI